VTQVFLGLGSNLEREKNIRAGLAELKKLFGALIISPIYESESIGFKGSHFFNLVVSVNTELTIAQLSEALKKIEDENGRVRTEPTFSPRTLDIDILTYGDFVGVEAGIELPRAEITRNAFVLLPLSDIAPQQLHPQLQTTYTQIWLDYDKSAQKLWPVNVPFTISAGLG
jgi:2-amino-4-hydroxy-6-hydroxymethyldihydropteridine diphosphokinase